MRLGLVSGFQWLSGSFLEDIETIEKRDPRDIDVVTFFHRPATLKDDTQWQTFVQSNVSLLVDTPGVKAKYKCDAYFVDLDTAPQSVVRQTRYWFGLFSHRRGGLWKGLLQVSLGATAADYQASIIVKP